MHVTERIGVWDLRFKDEGCPKNLRMSILESKEQPASCDRHDAVVIMHAAQQIAKQN